MPAKKLYHVIWKGKRVATLTRNAIAAEFERGAFGSLHSVEVANGKIYDIASFLNAQNPDSDVAESSERAYSKFNLKFFGLILGAFCFLSPLFLLPFIIYLYFFFKAAKLDSVVLVLFSGAAYFIAGFFFYHFLPELSLWEFFH